MRARATGLLLFTMLAVLAGACGGDKDGNAPTPAELGSALLVTTEVGESWTESQREVFESRPADMPVLDPGLWCPGGAGTAEKLTSLAQGVGALVELRAPATTTREFHGVREQLWRSADAKDLLKAAADGVRACTGQRWEIEGGPASMVALAGASAGDQSVTALVTYVTEGPDSNYEWRTRIFVARFDSIVMVLEELDVQREGQDARMSDAAWAALVEAAASRVGSLVGG